MKKIYLLMLLAFFLRIYGINWDQGFHLHPDERMLIMVADRIHFFTNLNPDFFNYGSLPIYLLKGGAQLFDTIFRTHFQGYDGLLILGRLLSAFFDVVTAYFVYKIAQLLFRKEKVSFLAMFLYTISFFPIQNAHFFVVDVFLTCFTTVLLYLLLQYLHDHENNRQRKIQIVKIALIFAAMMATKVTSLIFYPMILLIFLIPFLFTKEKTMKQLSNLAMKVITFHTLCFIFYFLFMPYGVLEVGTFIKDVTQQMKMNSDPYIFPYTLQYVGTLPYFYYLKNIFLWGLGPIISLLSLFGILAIFSSFWRRRQNTHLIKNDSGQALRLRSGLARMTIVLCFMFYALYFLVIGKSAVKFMRYILPLYPFFAVMAGYGLYNIQLSTLNIKQSKTISFAFIILTLLWTYMFMNIYAHPHPRITASEWMVKNIPAGSSLGVEHWDDRLPLFGGERYNFVEFPLYERPDDETKWAMMKAKIQQTDYIVLASNRLYVPLPKLQDCSKYKSCYPMVTEYYKELFNGQLGFAKVAEFATYPELSLFGITFRLDDQTADESFTVYDHPKVIIFKKI
ncbi:MAG: glycosyltransferase family 39 protein [bacterium]|nr:glycosyltransferase family 39 protein [bacterium]